MLEVTKNKLKQSLPSIWKFARNSTFLRSVYKLLTSGYTVKYVYFDKLDTVYVSIPKNASSTLIRLFSDKLDLPYDKNSVHTYKAKNKFISIEEYNDLNHNDTFVFVFTRNPLNRLVSCYENKVCNDFRFNLEKNYFGIFYEDMPFAEFAQKVCRIPDFWADQHFKSQASFIKPIGLDNVDYIGRVENFGEDIRVLEEKFGLEYEAEKNLNKTKSTSRDLTDYYTKPLAQEVFGRYKEDFMTLGYEKDFKKILKTLPK